MLQTEKKAARVPYIEEAAKVTGEYKYGIMKMDAEEKALLGQQFLRLLAYVRCRNSMVAALSGNALSSSPSIHVKSRSIHAKPPINSVGGFIM